MGLQWALQVVMRELWDDAGRVARWAEQQWGIEGGGVRIWADFSAQSLCYACGRE